MTKIKDITKELTGKSLCSFHRKTGLPQLEEANKMQDGILDGILSQVDDAYITKTEQSNVIHLEGSGDGVVVLDSIEGNTKVNLLNFNDIKRASNYNCLNIDLDKKSLSINTSLEFDNRYQYFRIPNITLYSNKEYTFVCNITKNTFSKTFEIVPYSSRHTNRKGTNGNSSHYLKVGQTGIHKYTFTMVENDIFNIMYADSNAHFNSGEVEIINPMILEGDWSDKEIPASYFEGLQSSFEEKVNDEGKYEIEILSNNKNLIDKEYFAQKLLKKSNVTRVNFQGKDCLKIEGNLSYTKIEYVSNDNKIKTFRFSGYTTSEDRSSICHYGVYLSPNTNSWSNSYGSEKYNYVEIYNYVSGRIVYIDLDSIQVEYGTEFTNYLPHKSNKIKVLINEPLRKADRLCVKDNKLIIERNVGEIVLNNLNCNSINTNTTNVNVYYFDNVVENKKFSGYGASGQSDLMSSNRKTGLDFGVWDTKEKEYSLANSNTGFWIFVPKSVQGKEWLASNPTTVIYPLAEPIYEEVTNEYGEPIILEGYENGTLYVDSVIVPTTTVRYTPKMESFKVCSEVKENNVALSSDINDNIITYMMDIDLMITERELITLDVQAINQRMEVLDMTSMQKRTQDMLARLIKGKTLTEQECKDRIILYVNANKITAEQAEELMLLISETYQ